MENIAIPIGALITISIFILGIIQAVFLFLWNNIRADLKSHRYDIKNLYEQDTGIKASMANMETNMIDRINSAQLAIMALIDKTHPDNKPQRRAADRRTR